MGLGGWSGLSDKEMEDSVNQFLYELEFTDDKGLSSIGKRYFQARHVYNDEKDALAILVQQVKKQPATQAICQLLWGRKNVKRRNIYNLLASERLIDVFEVSEEKLGAFLMLLNLCGIVVYSKQTGDVQVIHNVKGEEVPLAPDIFISKDTPYGNVINLRRILRSCNSYIYWIDKHFSTKGLEPLWEEADANKISTIKILAGKNENIPTLKSAYERFEQEMTIKGINSELRVICDSSTFAEMHDRWIIAKNLCYNVPPINSIYQNQSAELKETTNRPPFDKWWSIALPIKERYSDILQAIPSKKENNPPSER